MCDKRRPGRDKGKSYNGKLAIPLPFEDALKAATEVKAPEKPPRKPRQQKRAKS